MVPSNLKVLAKFGLCSNCSQKLEECSLARASKSFASAHMLGFMFLPSSVSITCILKTKTDTRNNVSPWEIWKHWGNMRRAMNASGKMLPLFVDVTETDLHEFSPR